MTMTKYNWFYDQNREHAPRFLVYFFDETRLHEDDVKLPKARTRTYDDEFSSPFLNLD